MSKTREIPMTAKHQTLVLAGRKTTTLRGERFEPGVYAMVAKDGACQGCCEVVGIDAQQVWWLNLKPDEQLALARTEGYETVRELERELQRLGHKKFQRGMRGLWLHRLKPA
jgi:hypothetical protein